MENPVSRKWWDPLTLRDGIWYRWFLLGAEVLVCRKKNHWHGLCKDRYWRDRTGECTGPEEAESCSRGTVLFSSGPEDPSAALRPLLPVKPFLLTFSWGLRLSPETELALDLELPFLLRLSTVKDRQAGEPVFTFKPFVVNETWYGDTAMEGLLCLSLNPDRPLDGPVEDAPENPRQTLRCRALLRNRAKTTVSLDRLPLLADQFSIYENHGELVTDTPVFDIFGSGEFRMNFASPDHTGLLVPGSKNGVGEMLIYHGTRIIKDITRH
ncbi:MAG: hypothetical protein LBE02_04150 [Spirochaetaceae bacterium]|jgi:hypothetical protein|nr:hypothetical protein [Spirochaetaceae bacterium]